MHVSAISIRLTLLGFAAGLVSPLALPLLPSIGWLLILSGGALLLGRPSRKLWPASAFFLAFSLSCFQHHALLQARLDPALDGQRRIIEGVVAGLPEQTELGWRFRLTSVHQDNAEPLPDLRVHWFAGEPVMPGELWRFDVRLRQAAGMSNPGGFDYERWLYAEGIGGLASVRHGERLDIQQMQLLHRLRYALGQQLAMVLQAADRDTRVLALISGDRNQLTADDWKVLQATGTSHLMVISGLHVGMLAAAVFALLVLAGRAGILPRSWPRLWLAVPPVLLTAAFYAALAGFAVPTRRALLMLALLLLARVLYRRPDSWVAWLGALLLVVLLEPAAPLRAGFWLSFMAVAVLLFGMGGRLAIRGVWWRWLRPQWLVFVGLWPWLVFWAMPGSVHAPLVNMLAIPWVSLLVVPLALSGSLLYLLVGISAPLEFAALLLEWLFQLLGYLASPEPHLLPFPGWLAWCIALLGTLMLLGPLVRLMLLPGILCLLPLVWPYQPRPSEGQLWVTVLDVGQGLSVLLQTRQYALLYDAGARLPSGFDIGEAVVYPALRQLGVDRLDLLLISHADNDHAGGAPALRQRLPIGKVLAGESERLPEALRAQPCVPGEHWYWNRVRFEVVHAEGMPAPANERSCVLRVLAGEQAVLLAGDIGVRTEYRMLGKTLAADVLLAPHHGSRSSSSYAFIRAVAPHWVVFSAGRYNSYNHPHPTVVERYRELGVQPVYTARSGALRWVLGTEAAEPRMEWQWRQRAARFWHLPMPPAERPQEQNPVLE